MAQTNLTNSLINVEQPHLRTQQNWQAIVSHLQLQLKQEGITVKVARKSSNLYVILEFLGENPPQQQQVVAILQQTLEPLSQSGIATVKIGAQRKGATNPLWVEKIELSKLLLTRDLGVWSQADLVINPVSWGYVPTVARGEGKKYLRLLLGDTLPSGKSGTTGGTTGSTIGGGPSDRLTTLLPLENIREVVKISPQKILAVPHSPDWLLGIYDWRGELIWLADLNRLLGFPKTYLTPGGMMISLQVQQQTLGLFIPEVEEIEQHTPDKLQEPMTGLLPTHLLPYVKGYISAINSIVLDPSRLIQRVKILQQ
jgi:chemotaxis signal transduction protein